MPVVFGSFAIMLRHSIRVVEIEDYFAQVEAFGADFESVVKVIEIVHLEEKRKLVLPDKLR